MKKYANAFLKWITSILEVVIALILAVTIIIMTFQLILSFQHLSDLNQYPNYDDMLTTCFNLIIGVEMIRMLYLHTRSQYLRFCSLPSQDRSSSSMDHRSTV